MKHKLFYTPIDLLFRILTPIRLSLNGEGAMGGAASGAAMGSIAGPYGMAIGAVAGGIMGALQKKKKEPEKPSYISAYDNAKNNLGYYNQRQTDAEMEGIARLQQTDPNAYALKYGDNNALQGMQRMQDQARMYQDALPGMNQSYLQALQSPDTFQNIGMSQSRDQGIGSLLGGQFQRAQEDAALRGALSNAQQAEISRASMIGGAGTGLRGKAVGDITARDLGLSSIQMDQQRQDRAGQYGQLQQGIMQDQRNYETGVDRYNIGLQQYNAGQNQTRLGTLGNAMGQYSGLAWNPVTQGFGASQSITPSIVGTGSDMMNLGVSDINARNMFNQQNAGIAAGNYNASLGRQSQDMQSSMGMLGNIMGGNKRYGMNEQPPSSGGGGNWGALGSLFGGGK